MAFEIGNPDLIAENTVGLDLSVRTRTGRLEGEVNVFAYDISNFVFLNVTEDFEDGLRIAGYSQDDSLFVGAEASGHVDLHDRAAMKLSVGWVRARLTATDEALPRIPPVHGRLEVTGRAGAFTFGPDVTFSARQSEVFRNETPTSGWVNFGFNGSWERQGSHSSHLVALSAFNLGNTTYRLHTSFLKDLAPEIGRGVKVSYTMRFF
jgi:iron complex outermembrane receptor protein